MKYPKAPTLEEVRWQDVKDAVAKVNPPFAALIDQAPLCHDFPLYKARYPFGTTIVKEGVFHVPTENGSVVPLDDDRIPHKIKEAIGYNSGIPMGIILQNSAELFMQPKGRIIPFAMMSQGKVFALWRVLNFSMSYLAPKVWHIVAGTRSVFFLPKITNAISYKKLAKARGLKSPIPRNLLEQGQMLAQIAKHADFSCEWYTEMLFFPPIWLKPQDDNGWIRFHHFLLQDAWESTEHWRNKVVYDFIWDSFIKEIVTEQRIKATPQVIDIVKHLILVGLGALPGFSPAISNLESPLDDFREDFINIYGLKKFAPTIMVPHHFSLNEIRPVYWSLQLPTHFESTPKPKTPNSIIDELREIKVLLEKFYESIVHHKLKGVEGTPISDFFSQVKYDFFHSESSPGEEISQTKEMAKEDNSLVKCPSKYGRRILSETSPFIRGCVRITKQI